MSDKNKKENKVIQFLKIYFNSMLIMITIIGISLWLGGFIRHIFVSHSLDKALLELFLFITMFPACYAAMEMLDWDNRRK